jgi:hypothetical protein
LTECIAGFSAAGGLPMDWLSLKVRR